MQLSNIKQFLEIYRKNLDTEEEKKKCIQHIIQKELGIFINIKNISFHKGIVQIKVNTIVKNEIFLQKENLLSLFKKESKENRLPQVHDIH